jgi:hypothetical protein
LKKAIQTCIKIHVAYDEEKKGKVTNIIEDYGVFILFVS